MANLTQKNVRDISRGYVSELDNQKITDAELNLWINLFQRDVQRDTWDFLSKAYIKLGSGTVTSGSSAVPTDMLSRSDAVLTGGMLTSVSVAQASLPTKELTMSEYLRISGNTYMTPSVTEPAYCLLGDANGARVFQFLPSASVTSYRCYYYYLPADLTSDSSTLSVPQETEKFVILKVVEMMYIKLDRIADSEKKAVEYQNELTKLKNMILKELPQAKMQDVITMQSNELSK